MRFNLIDNLNTLHTRNIFMNKQEYLKLIESLEKQGLDDAEIDAVIQDYLDQPQEPSWFFEEGYE